MAGAERATVGAGPLREKFAFDARVWTDDGAGNTSGDWLEQFVTAARRESLKGGEAVQAARLEDRQPYLVTIRYSAKAALITHEWRARDTRSGVAYGLSSVVVRPKRDYVDMIATVGPAEG